MSESHQKCGIVKSGYGSLRSEHFTLHNLNVVIKQLFDNVKNYVQTELLQGTFADDFEVGRKQHVM